MRVDNKNKGFTLIEMLVAVAILSIIMISIGWILSSMSKSFGNSQREVALQDSVQTTYSTLSGIVKEAQIVELGSDHASVIESENGTRYYIYSETIDQQISTQDQELPTNSATCYIIDFDKSENKLYMAAQEYNPLNYISGSNSFDEGRFTSDVKDLNIRITAYLLANYVEDFTIDLTKISQGYVIINIDLKNGTRTASITQNVYLRNSNVSAEWNSTIADNSDDTSLTGTPTPTPTAAPGLGFSISKTDNSLPEPELDTISQNSDIKVYYEDGDSIIAVGDTTYTCKGRTYTYTCTGESGAVYICNAALNATYTCQGETNVTYTCNEELVEYKCSVCGVTYAQYGSSYYHQNSNCSGHYSDPWYHCATLEELEADPYVEKQSQKCGGTLEINDTNVYHKYGDNQYSKCPLFGWNAQKSISDCINNREITKSSNGSCGQEVTNSSGYVRCSNSDCEYAKTIYQYNSMLLEDALAQGYIVQNATSYCGATLVYGNSADEVKCTNNSKCSLRDQSRSISTGIAAGTIIKKTEGSKCGTVLATSTSSSYSNFGNCTNSNCAYYKFSRSTTTYNSSTCISRSYTTCNRTYNKGTACSNPNCSNNGKDSSSGKTASQGTTGRIIIRNESLSNSYGTTKIVIYFEEDGQSFIPVTGSDYLTANALLSTGKFGCTYRTSAVSTDKSCSYIEITIPQLNTATKEASSTSSTGYSYVYDQYVFNFAWDSPSGNKPVLCVYSYDCN